MDRVRAFEDLDPQKAHYDQAQENEEVKEIVMEEIKEKTPKSKSSVHSS